MKTARFLLGLTLMSIPALAQVPAAKVTPFANGLKEPQGMAIDHESNILVCDYGSGEILKFGLDGTKLETFASNLKGPCQIVSADGGKTMFVSERKQNHIVRFAEGKKQTEMSDVTEPMGLVWDWDPKLGDGQSQTRSLWAVSYTSSKVYRKKYFDGYDGYNERSLVYASIPIDKDDPTNTSLKQGGGRYGFRWLAKGAGAYFLSDEIGHNIQKLSESGTLTTFASDISNPSGITVGPDNIVYVANEGDGGQLLRFNAQGEKSVVAENLGRPRAILFLNATTLIVSNRDGSIWKVSLA